MNIVAIDPSLNSTAIKVNDKLINYANHKNVFTKKLNYTKWYQIAKPYMDIKTIEYDSFDVYSEREIYLLQKFNSIADSIIDDIKLYLKPNEDTIVGIEGYSYSSSAGPLIDLVTFSTILRTKLYFNISKNITVIPPNKLKTFASEYTYEKIYSNKKQTKWVCRNNEGIAGGRFTKKEMFQAILDNPKIESKYISFLKQFPNQFTNIPKPFEDINDAVWIYYYLYNLNYE